LGEGKSREGGGDVGADDELEQVAKAGHSNALCCEEARHVLHIVAEKFERAGVVGGHGLCRV